MGNGPLCLLAAETWALSTGLDPSEQHFHFPSTVSPFQLPLIYNSQPPSQALTIHGCDMVSRQDPAEKDKARVGTPVGRPSPGVGIRAEVSLCPRGRVALGWAVPFSKWHPVAQRPGLLPDRPPALLSPRGAWPPDRLSERSWLGGNQRASGVSHIKTF